MRFAGASSRANMVPLQCLPPGSAPARTPSRSSFRFPRYLHHGRPPTTSLICQALPGRRLATNYSQAVPVLLHEYVIWRTAHDSRRANNESPAGVAHAEPPSTFLPGSSRPAHVLITVASRTCRHAISTHAARVFSAAEPSLCAQKLRNRSCGGAREATRRERRAPPVTPGQGPQCARATRLRSSRSCRGRGPRSASRSSSAGLAGWPLGAGPPAGPAQPAWAAPFAAPRGCARPAAAAPSGAAAAGALSLAPAASVACARPASRSPPKQASCSATPSIDMPDSLRSRLRPPGAERCLHKQAVGHRLHVAEPSRYYYEAGHAVASLRHVTSTSQAIERATLQS